MEVQAVFRLGRSGEWRRKKRWETASTVAGNPRVIWDHPGSSSVGGAMCMCVCAQVCLGAGGRQAQRNICSGPQGWPRVCIYVRVCRGLGGWVGMGCASPIGRQAPGNICSVS